MPGGYTFSLPTKTFPLLKIFIIKQKTPTANVRQGLFILTLEERSLHKAAILFIRLACFVLFFFSVVACACFSAHFSNKLVNIVDYIGIFVGFYYFRDFEHGQDVVQILFERLDKLANWTGLFSFLY